MKISDEIATAYLKGQKVNKFSGEWYYTSSAVAGTVGKNIFEEPKSDTQTREKVKTVYNSISNMAENFLPSNIHIWDALFPDWQNELSKISVDLIVGFPEPHDATVEYDPMGKCHIIFDLVCWAKYVGHCELSAVVQNLMTHELCHVLLHKHTNGLAEALTSTDYRTQLDAITFDEGFAHLISYNAMEIDTVDWRDKEFEEIWERNQIRMKAAHNENIPENQQKNLYDAICGDYYDKFACMCGMLYLADVWLDGELPALKSEFEKGYKNFAEKTAVHKKFT